MVSKELAGDLSVKKIPAAAWGQATDWRPIGMAAMTVLLFMVGFFVLDLSTAKIMALTITRWPLSADQGGNIQAALASKAEVYIFGSSRAKHHYEPGVIQAATNLSVYNAGADGQDIVYTRLLADLIERHHKPKIYIVNFSFPDVMANRYRWNRLSVFRIFAEGNPLIKQALKQADTAFSELLVTQMIKTYKFNGLLANVWQIGDGGQRQNNGFDPLDTVYVPAANDKHFKLRKEFDLEAIQQFVGFVRQARSKGIAVIFSIGPTYRDFSSFTISFEDWFLLCGIRQMAKEMNVPLIEIPEISDPVYRDATYYADTEHLNRKGAHYYSLQFARQLIRVLAIHTNDELQHSPFSSGIAPQEYTIPNSLFQES